jgi:hypothetical protein
VELAPRLFRKPAEPAEQGVRLERLDIMHVGLSWLWIAYAML